MDLFIGHWVVIHDMKFIDFLKFSGVPWIKRQIAEHNKIKICIEEWRSVYIKTISSPLYSTEEIIKLDGVWRDYKESSKKYSMKDNIINVSVKYKDSVFWEEEIYIKDFFLFIKYSWIKNDKKYFAVQQCKRK